MDLFGKEPRPAFNNQMRTELAKKLGEQVNNWCNNETSLEDCISDTEEILKHNINGDGYELAKEFEDKGYGADSELVEILDGVWFQTSKLVRDAIKRWVITDDIKPQFEIGTTVIVNYGSKKVEGQITDINTDTAEYLVCIFSEGMEIDKTRRAIIKYENAEALK